MVGLQGAGKTTTVAKLAGKLKSKGKRPLLVACDVYRPAAITQLQVNGEKQGVEVFSMGDKQNPVDIAKAAIEHAKSNQQNVVLIDTAGRLHIDEDMMQELENIKANVNVDATVLVGSKTIGFKATFPRVPTVPYLAKGAVIPPRSEFLAVLGDQKQGNNIETPEALLRKIVREETAGRQAGGGSWQFTAQINRRTLFDEMMKEAQMRRDTSGKNPFEMA